MITIVYESETGHARRYAEMLAQKMGYRKLSLKDAKKSLAKGDEVIFVGWVLANEIRGYRAARRRFRVRAVCAVGMFPECRANADAVAAKNRPDCPLFYLRGGLAPEKVKGMRKKLLQIIGEGLERGGAQNKALAELIAQGADFVCEENLAGVLALCLSELGAE